MTVTLKVSHPKGADALVVVVDEEVKRAMPKNDPMGAMFFAHEAQLFERDPRQDPLPSFRVVDDGKGAEDEQRRGEAQQPVAPGDRTDPADRP